MVAAVATLVKAVTLVMAVTLVTAAKEVSHAAADRMEHVTSVESQAISLASADPEETTDLEVVAGAVEVAAVEEVRFRLKNCVF